jgi:FkbH-like protein
MENLKYYEILQRNRALSSAVNGSYYKVAILSNVTINPFRAILEYFLRSNQINPEVEIGNFDNIVQDSAVVKDSNLVIIFYEILNIVDSISNFFENLSDDEIIGLKQKLQGEIDLVFQNLKTVPTVIFNSFSASGIVSQYTQDSKLEIFITELNQYIRKNKNKNSNVIVLDIDKIIRHIGIIQSFDFRLYYSSKAPYSLLFFKNYATALGSVIFRNTGRLKKALIFDCDNTLWKGIIGEDGIEGIDISENSSIGHIYRTVQQIAVFLSKRGVIIGICSKNNEQDVSEVFIHHPDMILREEHIVVKKINWKDKASNLKAIASELNIGTDSLIFVDDSSFEINLIKEQLPEVLTLQVPQTIYHYADDLLKTAYTYFNMDFSTEDTRKTEIYKQQIMRESIRTQSASIEDYLASLEISLNLTKDDKGAIKRVAQLTQKTNQFNLTTRRYSEGQIEQFMEDEKRAVFSLHVKDKFGDNGLTAVSILFEDSLSLDTIIIDTFLMSCRIIGRNIEQVFLNYIFDWARKKNYKYVKAEFLPTKKNVQVRNFYTDYGFNLIANGEESSQYLLDLTSFIPKSINYIVLETSLQD